MSYISGVQCEVCGTITFFKGRMEKGDLFKKMKAEGWTIIRKNGQIPERTFCPSHGGKEYRKWV